MNIVVQYSTLTSGTITANDTGQDVWVVHNAASLAITLTTTFPATPIHGQTYGITSTLGVTTLTLSSGLSIIGGLAAMAAGGFAKWMYDVNSNKWYRCG